MKKVVKKLNKALSVLLVAAMVVGMTPDAALTSYAAEDDQIEATTEAESTESQASSEATSEEDKDTVETETAETTETQSESQTQAEPETVADTESETTTVEATTEESEDNTTGEEVVEDGAVLLNNEPVEDGADTANGVIFAVDSYERVTIKYVAGTADSDTNWESATEVLTDNTTPIVVEGEAPTSGKISILVTPKTGNKVKTVSDGTTTYKDGDENTPLDADGVYTLDLSDATLGGNNVTFTVTTAKVIGISVTDEHNAATITVNTKAIGTSTDNSEDLTINVTDKADDNYMITGVEIKVGGETATFESAPQSGVVTGDYKISKENLTGDVTITITSLEVAKVAVANDSNATVKIDNKEAANQEVPVGSNVTFVIAPAAASPEELNSVTVEISTDGTTYTKVTTESGLTVPSGGALEGDYTIASSALAGVKNIRITVAKYVAQTVTTTNVDTENINFEITNESVVEGKTVKGKDVTFTASLKQTEDNKKLKVSYKIGSEGQYTELSLVNGVYKIESSKITDTLDIKAEVVNLYRVTVDSALTAADSKISVTEVQSNGDELAEGTTPKLGAYVEASTEIFVKVVSTDEDYKIKADTVKIKEADLATKVETTGVTDVYKITVGADADGATLTAEAEEKTYEITIPTTGTGITAVTYKKVAANVAKPAIDDINGTADGAITAKKGEKIYFIITHEGYKVAVTYPSKDAEDEPTTETITPDTNGIYEYVVKGTETEGLTITATATELTDVPFATLPTGVVVKYSTDKDAAEADFKSLDTITAASGEAATPAVLGLKDAGVGEKIYLLITTPDGKSIKSVQKGKTDKTDLTKVGDLYEYTVTKDDTITVAVDDTIILTFEKDPYVAALYYAEKDTAYNTTEGAENSDFKAVPADGKVAVAKGNSVYLYIDLAENAELAEPGVGVTQKAVENATKSGTTENYEVTADKAKTVKVHARKTIVTFNFTKVKDKTSIVSATGAVVVATGAASGTANVFKGDTYSFDVSAVDSVKSVTVKESSETVLKNLNNPSAPYSVKATGNKNITVDATEYATNLSVTFNGDTNTKSVTPIVAGTEKTAVEFKANTASVTNITEESSFSFKLTANDNYAIDTVKYTVGSTIENKLLIPDEDGVYTIPDGITADVTVTVTTTLDAKKVNTVTFTGSDINSVIITDSNGTTTETITDLTKPYVTTAKEIYFKITPAKNYTVTDVKDGTTVLNKVEAKEIYKLELADLAATGATKVDKSITITTEAAAATAAQKVQFYVPEDCVLAVTTEGVTKGADDVYTVPATVKELVFTVAVPYGKKANAPTATNLVAGADSANTVKQVGKRVLADNKRTWIYTYKVVVANLNAETTASDINVTTVQDTINVSVYEGSRPLRMRAGEWTDSNQGQEYAAGAVLQNVPVNEVVYVEVYDNYKLYTVTFDAADDPVFTEVTDIDSLGVYSFTAVPDGNVTLYAEWTGADHDAYIYDEFDTEEPYKFINSELGVDYNTSLTFALDYEKAESPENDTISAISKAIVKAGEEAAASKAVIDENGLATVTFDEKDAGKKLSIELYTVLTDDTTTEEILATTVVANVAPLATKVEIKGIKNNGTVKLEAATETKYALKLTPASITASLLDVTVDDKNDAAAAKVAKIVGNELVINTHAKAEKHVIAITDKTVKTEDGKNKVLLTFTVESVLPALKLSKLESPAQGTKDIIITLTGDKAIKATNDDAKLFYEVTVTPAEGTAPAGSAVKTVYFPYESTRTESIAVNTVTDRTKETKWDYTFDARIVMVDAATAATLETATTKLADDKVIAATAKTVSKKFSTRNAYYEDKLGVTKKTTKLYTGQTAIAAVVKYSKNASDLHIDDGDALVYNTDGTLATGFTVTVDSVTDEVSVKVDTDVYAGKYNLVLYAKAENSTTTKDMYQASATVPLTVVYGIDDIETTYPSKTYVAANKGVTIKTKTTGYGEHGKAATQKFKYELVTVDDGTHGVIDSRLADYLSINATNGTITVKKGIPLSKDADHNNIVIKISAADYTGNTTVEYAYVQLTTEAIQISEVYLASDYQGYHKLPTTLTAKEADYSYVIALDKDGKKIDPADITITPSNKKLFSIDSEDGMLYVAGAAKNVTFKVTANDGGKSNKTSAKYTFSALKAENLRAEAVTYDDYNGEYVHDNSFVQTSDKTFTYKGSRSFYVEFYSGNDQIRNDYYNYTVSVKGGKISNHYNRSYVTPTAKDTIVTFTDKETKNKTEFTFTNTAYTTAKAPAAKTTDKLYTNLYSAEDGSVVPQKFSFKLTKPNTEGYDAASVTLISAPKGWYQSPIYNGTYWINEDGEFGPSYYNGTERISGYTDHELTAAGTYKYSVVYGKFNDDGEFVPMTKESSLSVKVTKSAAVKPATSYKMNLKDSKSVALTSKPEYVDVKFTKLQNANVGGKANAFLTYFDLDANNNLILKTGVDTSKIEKKDLTGYVTYQYYVDDYNYNNNVGAEVEKQAKITVSFDTKDAKYTATDITVLNSATAEGTTTIKLGNTPVSIKSVTAPEGWKATLADQIAAPGVVTLKATAEPGVGKKKVTLSIVTTNSFYTDATAAATNITVNVNVVDPAKAKIKLDAKKSVINLNNEEGAWDASNVAKWVVVREAGVAYTFASPDVKITAAALDESATDALKAAVTVAKVADTNNIQFTILNKSLVKGNIPVKVEFANGAAEVVSFKLEPAKIATLDEVAAAVKAKIAALETTENKASDEAAVKGILDTIDPVTGIAYKDVVATITPATQETAASSKVTYTLYSKADSTVTKAEEVTLKAKTVTVDKLDAGEAYAALVTQVTKLVATEVSEANKGKELQVTKDTKSYEIRSFLQKAIENSDYSVAVLDYKITVDPTTSSVGKATFKYVLVNTHAVYPDESEQPVTVNSIDVAKLPATTETAAK